VLNEPYFFSIASLSYRIFFESKPFVFFPRIVNVRTIFEFTQTECHAGYFGDLAPFVWRAKTNDLCDVVARPIDSRVVKFFSFNGSRLITVRSSSVFYGIEIRFEIVNGMVLDISTDRHSKICVCFGRCFK